MFPVDKSSSGPPGDHSSNDTSQASQPVDLNNAAKFVKEVKNRFREQPDKYWKFLDILHTYSKDQINLINGIHTGTEPLTVADVYTQVAELFQDQADLLQGFQNFFPDPNKLYNLLHLQGAPEIITRGGSPGDHSSNDTSQAILLFDRVFRFVKKVQNRFREQPDKYQKFLDIIHTYQKDQLNLINGIHTGTEPLTDADVCTQVAELLQDQADLLQGFQNFLPDPNELDNLLDYTSKE